MSFSLTGVQTIIINEISATATSSSNSNIILGTGNFGFFINISAVSGTNETLDLCLQETYDNGANFKDTWHVERVTTSTTTRIVPCMPIGGSRRWIWNISGTSPSYTFTISACQSFGTPPIIRKFFDRTSAVLTGTLNSTTSAYDIAGCTTVCVRINAGTSSVAPQYTIQLSDYNSLWSSVGTATSATASSTTTITCPTIGHYIRLRCTSAGTDQIAGSYVSFTGSN